MGYIKFIDNQNGMPHVRSPSNNKREYIFLPAEFNITACFSRQKLTWHSLLIKVVRKLKQTGLTLPNT